MIGCQAQSSIAGGRFSKLRYLVGSQNVGSLVQRCKQGCYGIPGPWINPCLNSALLAQVGRRSDPQYPLDGHTAHASQTSVCCLPDALIMSDRPDRTSQEPCPRNYERWRGGDCRHATKDARTRFLPLRKPSLRQMDLSRKGVSENWGLSAPMLAWSARSYMKTKHSILHPENPLFGVE